MRDFRSILGALICGLAAVSANGLPADVNGDGNVSALDIQVVINHVLGIPIDPYTSADADVTGNGQVDARDVQTVINYVLGILPHDPHSAEVALDAPGQVTIGAPFSVVATLTDNGAPVGHAEVVLTITPELDGAEDQTRVTHGDGRAQFSDLALSEPGVYEITATAGAFSASTAVTAAEPAPQTGVIHPGEFTEFADGLLLGAHPHAIEEPLEVEVEWFDPAVDPALGAKDGDARILNRFIQITALGLDEDESLVRAPVRAGFVVGIPVPADFADANLAALTYDYGDFALAHGDDGEAYEFDDVWLDAIGVFDPEYRLFLAEVPTIGDRAYPARLGVAEHPLLHTETVEPILDWLVAEYFPAAEQASGPRDMPSWNAGRAGVAAKSQDVGFDVRCELAEGHLPGIGAFPDVDPALCEEDAVPAIVEAVEDALYGSVGPYKGLVYNPTPRIKTTGDDYRYYVYNEHTRSACANIRGGYRGYNKRTFTCLRAALEPDDDEYPDLEQVARTTQHELFHAIQFDYASRFRSWVTEGTASLAEDIDLRISRSVLPSGARIQRRVDRSLIREEAYAAEYFWFDLLKRAGMDTLEDLGHLFNEGLRTSTAEDFVQGFTEFDTLGEAHWRWARNATFEGDVELPTIWDDIPVRYDHDCEPNWGALFDNLRYTLNGPMSVTVELDRLSATLLEFEIPPDGEHHYYEVSFETLNPTPGPPAAPTRPGPMTRLYTQEAEWDPIGDECIEVGESVMAVTHGPEAEDASFPLEGTVGTVASAAVEPSAGEPRKMYVLISNPDRNWSDPAEFRISITGPHYDAGSIPFPDKDDFHPTANDYHFELGSDIGGQIDALENDDPGYGGGELTIVAPEGTLQTAAGNTVEAVAGAFWYSLADSDFDGDDSFEYTIENEHGFQDSATVTVTRDITPIAEDISRSLPLAESGPLEIDVLAEASNPIEGDLRITRIDPVIGFDTGLIPVYEVPIIGDVEITGPESAQVIEYTPGPIENIFLGYVDRFVYTIENDLDQTDWAVVAVARGGAGDPAFTEDFEIAEEDIVVAPDPGELDICQVSFGGGPAAWASQGSDGLRRSFVDGPDGPIELPRFRLRETVVKGVHSSGEAIGWFGDFEGVIRPFAWTEDSGLVDLTPVAKDEDFQGRAISISQDGFVAGQLVAMEGDSYSVPVVWENGNAIDLGDHFDTSAMATSVSDQGQVIGVSGLDDPSAKSADGGAKSTPPDPLGPFGPSGPACGVGPTLDTQLLDHGAGGFIYTPDSPADLSEGQVTPLDSLGGGATIPRAINDDGLVVGSSLIDDPGHGAKDVNERLRGFVWDAERGILELPGLGGLYSEAFAVNNNGVVVGAAERDDGAIAGFAWEQGMLLDLNDLLPDGSPWEITMATEISDDGDILVWAYNNDLGDGELYPIIVEIPSVE